MTRRHVTITRHGTTIHRTTTDTAERIRDRYRDALTATERIIGTPNGFAITERHPDGTTTTTTTVTVDPPR